MKRIKQILTALLIVFVVMQFIRPDRNQNAESPQSDISKIYSIPDSVHTLLKNACFDCHSNNTNYPWYSNIQPMGWLIAKDIENGKAKLNFSEFGTLSPRKQRSRLQQIENQIK
ncbi:MAG: heme-binding domain-containing protein, partial [Bacteroidota bacterium]